tara:strand:+ start:697 stop:1095 length:399 start_codon:yes stop_codon:yes gene_type:complete
MSTKTGSNAIFTGTGQEIVYVKDFCYAYSGVIGNIGSSEATMCVFQTPKAVITGKVLFNYVDNDTEDYRYRIYFNGQIVQAILQGRRDYDFTYENAIPLVIPPLTEVKLTAQNIDNSNERAQIVSFTGRVHG